MLSTPHENAVEQVREPFLAPCRSGGSEHSGLLRHYQEPHGLRNHLSASDQRSNHLRSGVCEADGARFHQRYHIQQAAGRRGFHGSRAAGVFRQGIHTDEATGEHDGGRRVYHHARQVV